MLKFQLIPLFSLAFCTASRAFRPLLLTSRAIQGPLELLLYGAARHGRPVLSPGCFDHKITVHFEI